MLASVIVTESAFHIHSNLRIFQTYLRASVKPMSSSSHFLPAVVVKSAACHNVGPCQP